MSKEKIKVLVSILRLKPEFTNRKTISIGNKTVRALPGEDISVPRNDTDMWLRSGRFDFVRFAEEEFEVEVEQTTAPELPDDPPPAESDLPDDIPARDVLVSKGITFEQVKQMEKKDLVPIKGIGRNFADQILQYLHPETDENEGGNQ